jgi:Bacteriocin-protection, YdeI or OmpD-Associated
VEPLFFATSDEFRGCPSRAFREGREFFQAQPASYRQTAIYWVVSAKREQTRARRLATLISDSAAGGSPN